MKKKRNEQKHNHKPAHTKKAPPKKTENKVLAFLNSKPQKKFSLRQIAKSLGIRNHKEKVELGDAAEKLAEKGKIELVHGHAFRASGGEETLVGKVDFVNPAYAFIMVDELEDDIRVKGHKMKGAFHDDIVRIRPYISSRSKRMEGEVLEIVERGNTSFAGTIELSSKYAFVVPNHRKMHTDIFVSLKDTQNAQNGDKVIVEITQWPKKDQSPEGKVTKVLGKAGENETEIHSIMFEYGLPFDFPSAVEKAAEKIPETFHKSDIAKRRDFRSVPTFTVDPVNAKDFDDALSIRKTENGLWEIGVHIADVSHYVQPDSVLEKEAFKRATSVYLVDRTVPMLPEKLSNGLCSLRPHEDKFTFSAVFEMDENAKVSKKWFGRTIIHSDRRFTYEDAQEGIETGQGDFAKELTVLNDLAKKMRDKRFAEGAISFETTEYYFELDEAGKPIKIMPKIRKDAHKLIEEFMLLANKHVATHIFNLQKSPHPKTMIYRVHEDPDPERVMTFAKFAKRFGYQIKTSTKNLAGSINEMALKMQGKKEETILQYQAIRTMSKARYTVEPLGHYGLAFEHYTHFTSPIRRYPDMMVHRLLQHYLDGGKSVDPEAYEEKCKHSSEMEKRAADAERASIKYKQVEFMQQFHGKEFDGIVSGLTDWGIYVEMNTTKCEGLCRLADMPDDHYNYDEERQYVAGKRTGRIFRLGDEVTVRVTATNLQKRTIDLEFAQ